MKRLENKVAIVTGAASGIGRATVLRYAAEGAAVVVADIDETAGPATIDEVLAAGGRGLFVRTDVSDPEDVERVVATAVGQFGGLDVMHNNVALQTVEAMSRDGDIADFDPELFDRAITINLRGTILGCKYAIPAMLERGRGSIINTASIAALTGSFELPIYGMTKAAVIALSRYVAAQHGRAGIRCNTICPGTVDTPAFRANSRSLAESEAPLLTPRLGRPEDIAGLAAFLASDDSAYITGQVIVADGGRTSHR